jgi:hypothetical protein
MNYTCNLPIINKHKNIIHINKLGKYKNIK